MTTHPPPSVLRTQFVILLALGPFAFGYFLSNVFRAVNAVVAPNLVSELEIDPAQLGFLTGAYLLGFSAVQLPLGVLLDRFGPRRVQAMLFMIGAAGALLFSLGTSLWTLTLARGLIGIAFAGGLIAGIKAVVIWVPEPFRASANACIMAFGALGVISATMPAELIIQSLGWRGLFMLLAAITLAVALLVLLAVPERKEAADPGNWATQLAGLREILGSHVFWRLAPLLAFSAGTHLAVQTLWAGPWFADVAGFDRTGVAWHLLILALAFLAGALLMGFLTDWLHSRGISRLTSTSGFLVAFFISQATLIWGPETLMIPSWIVFGMTGQCNVVAFAWLTTHYGSTMAGRASTAMNLGIFGFAFLAQYLIGVIIQQFAPDASGAYPEIAYQTAFGACLALQLIAFAWYLSSDFATATAKSKPADH